MQVWTPEIVRCRWVEAADTDRRLPRVAGPAGDAARGIWRESQHSLEDMADWSSERRAEHAAAVMAKTGVERGAVARLDEVMHWTASYIHETKGRRVLYAHRKLPWAWAFFNRHGAVF